MSKGTSAGRKPISSKPAASKIVTEDIFGNPLGIPDNIKKELEDRGFIGRWVNAKELYSNQGYHKRGWVPFKSENSGTIGIEGFQSGSDPSGIVRRGDCILAVKTKEAHAKHKQYLEEKAARYSGYSKVQAEELRETAKAAGVRTRVEEGYGDDEADED